MALELVAWFIDSSGVVCASAAPDGLVSLASHRFASFPLLLLLMAVEVPQRLVELRLVLHEPNVMESLSCSGAL